MANWMKMGVAALAVALAAPRHAAAQTGPRLAGTVWMQTSPAAPAGTFRIFLADGTHVTGSCSETYRLDRWSRQTARRVTVNENGTAIPMDVTFSGTELRLRLLLKGGAREERFRPARVPFLCPEGRR